MNKISIITPLYLSLQMDGKNLVGYFAEQGNNEAVNQLLANGGKLEDAIYGYAIAGNKRQIDHFLQSTPNAKLIGKAIRGYARSEHFNHIHAIENYRDYKADLVAGLAEAGNIGKISPILDHDICYFDKAVEGYASGNQEELLTKLIKGTKYYPLAIYHAARSGQRELVNDLLKQCGIQSDYRVNYTPNAQSMLFSRKDINAYSLLNRALQGYTAGRHFNDAAKLLERGTSIIHAIAEIKDSGGLPSHEMYLALLAHIKSAEQRDAVLTKINKQGYIEQSLNLTPSEIKHLEQIAKEMGNINHIEARYKVENEAGHTPVKGDITLPYLAKIVSNELSVKHLLNDDCFRSKL